MALRRRGELLLPGCLLGLLAGGVAGGLAAGGGLPGRYVAATTLGLAIPLALAGAGYNALLAAGRVRLGGVTPAVGYWLLCFPAARVIHEFGLDATLGRPFGLPDGPLAFVGFQALVSTGFAVGFIWLHEHLAPLWWVHIRHRSPVAQRYVDVHVRQVEAMERRKSARSAKKNATRPR